jgi:hypothetical protein
MYTAPQMMVLISFFTILNPTMVHASPVKTRMSRRGNSQNSKLWWLHPAPLVDADMLTWKQTNID